VIDETHATYHNMQLVDIDGDGELEVLTGKRWKAHNGGDPGDLDDVFICYYKFKGGKFERFDIDEGTPGECSGVGIYFWCEDINNDGKLEIIAPGKEGLFLFERE
ncbi:MAG: VCBS repeat-containing protein, partial [Armatimonadetes bacterium]|nr:VCBS repeat-containing protein [Candidatus Hippobium faecium]